MYNQLENNKLTLAGEVISKPEFYHEVYDEKFYTFNLSVSRLSDNNDTIPVIISEKILKDIDIGTCINIDGQLRTYNKYEDSSKRKLMLFAFVKDYQVISAEELAGIKNPNELIIVGFLCKAPVYRKTPLGREITDLLVAVNRQYKKSDYIPSIVWGRNARYCENLEVGTCVQITGRIQSRNYIKKTDDNTEETRTAYEVSASRVKVLAADEKPEA
jgi:single-stranded DNA-binding protein